MSQDGRHPSGKAIPGPHQGVHASETTVSAGDASGIVFDFIKSSFENGNSMAGLQSTSDWNDALFGAAITAALVSVGYIIARLEYDTYKEGKGVPIMTIIIVLSSVVGSILLIWALWRM